MPSLLGHGTVFFCFKSCSGGSRGTRTRKRPWPPDSFQDRFLIRPDDFRLRNASSGGWSRTNGLLVQSQVSRTDSDNPGIFERGSLFTTALALHPRSSLGGLGCSTGSNCPGSDAFMTRPERLKFGEQDLNLHILVQSQAAYR